MSGRIIGIDLGTINSCVAVVQGGRAVVLQEDASTTIPSCLAFVRGKEIVGESARRQAVTDPHSTVTAVKRLVGHSYDSDEVQRARERVPYPIRPSPLGNVVLEVGGKELTPVQVSARILHRIKDVAEKALGERVTRAVISVPAHFTDVQRKATKLAIEYAGLEAVRLINEPTAAAFAYGYRKGENFTLAVYDLGGGTFDITVMTGRGDTFEVDATDGDSFLGGEDFDQVIVDWLKVEFLEEFGAEVADDEAALLRMKEAAELAKIELSDVAAAEIELPYLTELPDGTRPHFSRTLTREKLGELCGALIARTLELCGRCLEESGIHRDDVDEVLLVGGQTRMVQLRESVRDFFGKEPRRDINPDEVVAMGAALYGYSLEAETLRDQAEEQAEEEFAVALRGSQAAREMLDQVVEIEGTLDDSALAARLEALLDQVESEFDSAPTPASPDQDDLPAAVAKVDEELFEISRRTGEIIQMIEARSDVPAEKARAMAERLEKLVRSARNASSRAQNYLEEVDEHASARKVDLIDVTSHALGIAAAADVFSILIPKNSPVPASEERIFTTHQDGQTEVEIRVFQGSQPRARENQALGGFVLEGIPPAPRMIPRVEVCFEIDADGIMNVTARDADSGSQQVIRIEDPLGLQQLESDDPYAEEMTELGADARTEPERLAGPDEIPEGMDASGGDFSSEDLSVDVSAEDLSGIDEIDES